jgi:single-strand DNA-binding protein
MPAATQEKKTERNTEKKGEVTKVGNLTREPELSFTPNGLAVVRTGLAVERPKVTGDWAGERVTEFYELVMFRQLAENAGQSLPKGTRVVVTGDAELEHWTGDDGQDRTTKKILVNAIGPDLRWATCAVNKAERRSPAEAQRPTTGAPAPRDIAEDEEPF